MSDALAISTNDRPTHRKRFHDRPFGVSVNLTHAKVAREKKPAPEPARPAPVPAVAAPAAKPAPIPIKGRVLAKISNYQALWQSMRDRVSELQITMLELDGLSQACDGYSAKILGPSQMKTLGKKSLGRMLRGTGTYLVLVEDPDATAEIEAFASKRVRPERNWPGR